MIRSATVELLALAEAMRGAEWRDELAPALVACHNAGWDWKRTFTHAARLLVTEDARPHDLAVAARKPLERTSGCPPSDAYRAVREAIGRRDG